MRRVFDRFFRVTGLVPDPSQRSVVSRVSAALVNGAVAFSLLGTAGVDTSPLVAAAGVTGATIGFACKDIGANFVASMALAGQPALQTGNHLSIGTGPTAVHGEVVNWDTRYLYLRDKSGHTVHIPNNMVLTSVILWNAESKPTSGPQAPAVAKDAPAVAKDAPAAAAATPGPK